jgi:dihydroxyacetone kinase-like predicted kinase
LAPTTSDPGLDGTGLFEVFRAAGRWLDTNAAAINAINVFPVPDGDTGSNMSLTSRRPSPRRRIATRAKRRER